MSSQTSKATTNTEKRANGPHSANAAAAEAMRRHGLSYPETHEDFPWEDHRVLKVRGKVFVFMSMNSEDLSLSVKLPQSKDIALMLPFATPTGYGLGKSGWVSASFPAGANPPVDMILDWIDESYRAIAPKKLVAQLGAPRGAVDSGAAAGDAKAPAKKAEKKPAKAGTPASKTAKAGTPASKAAKAGAPASKAVKAVKAGAPASKAVKAARAGRQAPARR